MVIVPGGAGFSHLDDDVGSLTAVDAMTMCDGNNILPGSESDSGLQQDLVGAWHSPQSFDFLAFLHLLVYTAKTQWSQQLFGRIR